MLLLALFVVVVLFAVNAAKTAARQRRDDTAELTREFVQYLREDARTTAAPSFLSS